MRATEVGTELGSKSLDHVDEIGAVSVRKASSEVSHEHSSAENIARHVVEEVIKEKLKSLAKGVDNRSSDRAESDPWKNVHFNDVRTGL